MTNKKNEVGVPVGISEDWGKYAPIDYDALSAATLAGQPARVVGPKIEEAPKPQIGPAVIPPF